MKSNIHSIVHAYLNGETTDEQFKVQVTDVIAHFEERVSRYILLQDIGLIVQERENKIGKSDKFDRIWLLLDEIEPAIRKNLHHHAEAMKQ